VPRSLGASYLISFERPALDRGHLRLAAWIATSLVLAFTLYFGPLSLLLSGLDNLLSSTLGTVFPAYPFLALLFLLTALRWRDFHEVLLTERGPAFRPATRAVGLLLILLPIVLWYLFIGKLESSDYLAMEVAAAFLVLMAYGTLLVLNPLMWRIMLPYACLYSVGMVAPLFMLDTVGAPMALVSGYVASWITTALGIHVAWNGVSFGFVSVDGESITSIVTPACSAVYSISIYLALLGLMYLDMGSSVLATVKYAIVGVALIPLLDSARIAIMIVFGFFGGSSAFWAVHDWLGYAIFLAFYVAVLIAYSRSARAWRGRETAAPIPGGTLGA
jgi:exosortase/archaeosortase family protein